MVGLCDIPLDDVIGFNYFTQRWEKVVDMHHFGFLNSLICK